ncbi:putative nucleotidyltransferase [Actimicrobium sp. GrIS 1.19]|uniref:nucleotidyltransferase family protein n=1 Tax=Actimicrobium sp. GrIS 1.19 TaxID=3071708 RepID=UPI002E094BA5|nr:putative nucleotidyltransferase [Actimicrobium sp. GrIS 1.19]
MRPSTVLELNRPLIREAVRRFRAANPRVFRASQDGAGIDVVVDALPGATRVDLGGLQQELESRLGVLVTVWTPTDLPPALRDSLLAEARPV